MVSISAWNPEKLPQFSGRTIEDALVKPLIDPMRNAPAVLVLAGTGDSLDYAQSEWVLDKFQQRYPSVPTRKHPLSEADWPEFIQNLTASRGWNYDGNYVIYREALGNPFLLIGSLDKLRMYLKQLYHFTCCLIPPDLVEGHIKNNHAELLKIDNERSAATPPEDVWKVSLISCNHLEVIPLLMLHALGTEQAFPDDKRIELTVHNATRTYEDRHNFNWWEEPINDYFEENRFRFEKLAKVSYTDDINQATKEQDLVVILWSLRQEVYDALEGRTYLLREGMDANLITMLCQELFTEFEPILSAFLQCEDLSRTKVLLTSSCFKAPLSAVGSYLFQRLEGRLPAAQLLANVSGIENGYRSIIAEEIEVRTADVVGTAIWGDIGGSLFFDPTEVEVYGHKGVIEAPKGIDFARPLLQIFSDPQKLQVEFSVDTLLRTNYMELLEGPRHSSLLTASSVVEIIRRWNGLPPKQSSRYRAWMSAGAVTTAESGLRLAPGFLIALPVRFLSDNRFEILNQNNREEIRTATRKGVSELAEFLNVMKKDVDPGLPEVPPVNFPEIGIISETDSVEKTVGEKQASGGTEQPSSQDIQPPTPNESDVKSPEGSTENLAATESLQETT